MTCEFRLASDETVLGSKTLDNVPKVDDDVTIEGKTYRVDTAPENTKTEPVVVYVRKTTGI